MKTLKNYIYVLILSSFSLVFGMQELNNTKHLELLDAIRRADISKIGDSINSGADINYEPKAFFDTALIQAITRGSNPEIVKYLLDAGADVYGIGKGQYPGYTPIEIVQHLLIHPEQSAVSKNRQKFIEDLKQIEKMLLTKMGASYKLLS